MQSIGGSWEIMRSRMRGKLTSDLAFVIIVPLYLGTRC